MPDDPRFNSAFASAQQALDLARDFEVPPTPPVFEVFLTHVCGMTPVVSEAVEKVLSLDPPEREEALTRIHDDHLGMSALHSGLTRIRQGLTTEIADISLQISDGMKGNLSLATELRKTLRELAEQVTKEDVRNICKALSGTNREHLTTTQGMADQLQRTQSQLDEMQKELTLLRKSAATDHLTNLPNRRYLDEKLTGLIESKHSFCFAMLDLDHFKKINDTWGHSVGDNILRRLGDLLRQNTKGKDVACRVGGEEFALILPDTSLVGAEKLCNGICEMFSAITWITQSSEEEIGTLSLSGGVTAVTGDDNAATIYDRADKLLYQAKETGRNRIIAG